MIFFYYFSWSKVLSTGITLIVIITILIVGLYTTHADDEFDNQAQSSAHLEIDEFCKITISQADNNIRITDVNLIDFSFQMNMEQMSESNQFDQLN